MSVAKTLVEAALLIISIVAFKPPINTRVYYLVGKKIGKQEILSQFRTAIFKISEAIQASNATAAASGVFDLAKMIYEVGIIQIIFDAIISELDFWDVALFVATSIPQILAFILSGGAAAIAKIAVVVLNTVSFTLSVLETVETCDI
ncbi:hypothetical protein D5R40_11225 [Okeania hirsuta]|uniref:Uncharacterized protein n=1 Tax=Okeania hirsuta TaxID=1458930 RepID=A0A3N6PC48_9CYAN|nr:hypothetical protein [Okeania hirsuta]RQH44758.1 hypothetical protein D5R40_11225 [Okeania hirsuta]